MKNGAKKSRQKALFIPRAKSQINLPRKTNREKRKKQDKAEAKMADTMREAEQPLLTTTTHLLQQQALLEMTDFAMKALKQQMQDFVAPEWVPYLEDQLRELNFQGFEFDPFDKESILHAVVQKMLETPILYVRPRKRCDNSTRPFYVTVRELLTLTNCDNLRQSEAMGQEGFISVLNQEGKDLKEVINLGLPPIDMTDVLDLDTCELMCDTVLDFLLTDPIIHRQLLFQIHQKMPAFERVVSIRPGRQLARGRSGFNDPNFY